ncbi:hypothetical protein FOZ63_002202 [Perkinsus olseni]|uniref:Uncharacterized protein n=1 Tax=Perkinsus olseni TaxID=32597 RepID=A0A7J6SY35_PEROL|nr:hypothetical protein FOZ63_002202 [Perkinsus olseni]
MSRIIARRRLFIFLATLALGISSVDHPQGSSAAGSPLTLTSDKRPPASFSQLRSRHHRHHRRILGRRRRRRHVNPAAADEESSFMNGKQFKAWLDNLFSSAERSREDEMRLMEQRDPILSQYDPETMPLDDGKSNSHLHRHHQHHHRGAFFESAEDTANADYDDAELGWD